MKLRERLKHVALPLAAILVATFIFWRQHGGAEKAAAPAEQLTVDARLQPARTSGESKVETRPPPTGAKDAPTRYVPGSNEPFVISTAALNEIHRCLGDQASPESLDDLSTLVRARHAAQGNPTETFLWENLHFKLPDSGEARRLRLTAGEGGRIRLQLYGEDAEGLPVPLELPGELTGRAEAPALAYGYLKKLHVKPRFREQSHHVAFGGDAQAGADVVEENGSVRSYQYSAPGVSLGCSSEAGARVAECRCEK